MARLDNALLSSVIAWKPYKQNQSGGEQEIFGIKRTSWPSWQGWVAVDAQTFSEGNLDQLHEDPEMLAMASKHMDRHFWEYMCLSGLTDQGIANDIFEAALCIGRKPVISALQKSTNLFVDNDSFYRITEDGQPDVSLIKRVNRMASAGNPIRDAFFALIGYKLASDTDFFKLFLLSRKD